MAAPYHHLIEAIIGDVRKLDDEAVTFVRRNVERLRGQAQPLDTIVDQLEAMGAMRPELGIDMLVRDPKGHRRVLSLRRGDVAIRFAKEVEALARELYRRGMHWRLPPHGYTAERTAEVIEAAKRRDREDIPWLVEYLGYATSPTDNERALRREIFDALSYHQTPQIAEIMLRALASEPDDLAAHVIDRMWRQDEVIATLPARIDDAWRPPRDERLARRLLAALVKSDDDRKYTAWAVANYPALVRELGL